MDPIKATIQRAFNTLGYQISKLKPSRAPATPGRPIGQLKEFLEDTAARGFAPRHVLDVGANRGHWTRTAAAVFPEARFTMIEPQIEMKPDLDKLCEDRPGTLWLNVGAGAETAVCTLHIFSDRGGCTFESLPEEQMADCLETRQVEVVTLDSLIDDYMDPLPDLVKLDVEGLELDVLKGASRLLEHTELFLLELSLFEFRPGRIVFSEVVETMDSYGYQPYDLTWHLRRPSDGALGLVEMAFAKNEGFLRSNYRW